MRMRRYGLPKRSPVYFRGFGPDSTGYRYSRLSKADWADVFCDLYRQCFGEDAAPEAMLSDAERRVALLKVQGIR